MTASPFLSGPQPSNAGKTASPLDPSGSSTRGARATCAATVMAPTTAVATNTAASRWDLMLEEMGGKWGRESFYVLRKMTPDPISSAGPARREACSPRRDFRGVLRVGEIRDVDPRVTHLVDGSIAVADSDVRIGVGFVRRRVVVPRGHFHHGPLGHERRGVVGEDVRRVPVERELVDVTHDDCLTTGQDRFERYRLAAQMHVRLEAFDAGRLLERVVRLARGDRVGWNVDRAVTRS